MNTIKHVCISFFLLFFAMQSMAQSVQAVNQLNAEMAAIERDITALEESYLFPPVTRVKVYLSQAMQADFTLKSVSLSIDDRERTFHIYSAEEISALRLGGLQALWEGNIALGNHRVLVKFKGVDRKGAAIEEQATLNFEKAVKGHVLEVQINANNKVGFGIKDWGEK